MSVIQISDSWVINFGNIMTLKAIVDDFLFFIGILLDWEQPLHVLASFF